jgi:hypothetical protein
VLELADRCSGRALEGERDVELERAAAVDGLEVGALDALDDAAERAVAEERAAGGVDAQDFAAAPGAATARVGRARPRSSAWWSRPPVSPAAAPKVVRTRRPRAPRARRRGGFGATCTDPQHRTCRAFTREISAIPRRPHRTPCASPQRLHRQGSMVPMSMAPMVERLLSRPPTL